MKRGRDNHRFNGGPRFDTASGRWRIMDTHREDIYAGRWGR
jgi:hypothetical protein